MQPAMPPAPPPPARRILVVDDSRDTAESFAMLLKAMGHTCEWLTDPLAAVATAQRFGPDIVFLDVGMPQLDGCEVATRLRAECGEQMAIVAITGHGSAEDRVRVRGAGFDAHVMKPVDFAILESIVATVVGERQFRR
jgi:DNA-binding response OmpR family regulator